MNDLSLSDFPNHIRESFVDFDDLHKSLIPIKKQRNDGVFQTYYVSNKNQHKDKRDEQTREARLDNRRTMVKRAICGLVGKCEKSDRIKQTIYFSYRQGGNRATKKSLSRGWNKNRFLISMMESAVQNNVWFKSVYEIAKKGSRLKSGYENEPYLSNDGKHVIKLNNLSFLNDDDYHGFETTRNFDYFVERLYIHNVLFPQDKYEIVGFGKNSKGETCIVLKQPFVKKAKLASYNKVEKVLLEKGFKKETTKYGLKCFSNGKCRLSDVKPQNVLIDMGGNLRFIDLDVEMVR